MAKLSNILLALSLVLIAYSVFSNFYGEPGVAFKIFKSSSFAALGNFFILLSILAAVKELSKKG